MMKILGWVLAIFGVLLAASGALWALQGLGIVMWPAESFMLAQREWAAYGTATMVVGLVLASLGIKLARRR